MSITLTHHILGNYKSDVFVETGTYQGGGVDCAILAQFSKIISIERNPAFLKGNLDKFNKRENVELICGNTEKILYEIIAKINCRITFWLDAHDIGGPYCPLLKEIEQIARHKIKNHIILIDDRIVFRHWGFTEHDVISMLKKINPKYEFNFIDSKLRRADIMTAVVPKKIKVL